MRPSVLECRDFSFSYGAGKVLEKIAFRLEAGAWLTLLGPNGSGKSTLLKCLLRLARGKSSGEARILDRPLQAYSQIELARLLAYVPQAGGRIAPFSVRDFVNLSRYPYAWHGSCAKARHDESVDRALELTNTLALAQKRMDALSGGQRQRVYLAAALAQDTDILLLDEPAAFLDPHHAYLMNELLKKLHEEEKKTIIAVSHDLNLPFDAGGMALVIRDGRQMYFGSAMEMRDAGILDQAFGHAFSYLAHPRTGKTVVAI